MFNLWFFIGFITFIFIDVQYLKKTVITDREKFQRQKSCISDVLQVKPSDVWQSTYGGLVDATLSGKLGLPIDNYWVGITKCSRIHIFLILEDCASECLGK